MPLRSGNTYLLPDSTTTVPIKRAKPSHSAQETEAAFQCLRIDDDDTEPPVMLDLRERRDSEVVRALERQVREMEVALRKAEREVKKKEEAEKRGRR